MKLFKKVVNPDFHFGIIGPATKGFVTTPLVDILENIQRLYGKSIYQELEASLLRLSKLMNIIQPVEVMIRGIEEVKLFLLYNLDEDCALTKPNLISYALIKFTQTRGMYAKGIEKWHKRPPQDRRKWA